MICNNTRASRPNRLVGLTLSRQLLANGPRLHLVINPGLPPQRKHAAISQKGKGHSNKQSAEVHFWNLLSPLPQLDESPPGSCSHLTRHLVKSLVTVAHSEIGKQSEWADRFRCARPRDSSFPTGFPPFPRRGRRSDCTKHTTHVWLDGFHEARRGGRLRLVLRGPRCSPGLLA